MDTACQDGASFQKKTTKARGLYLPARGIIDFPDGLKENTQKHRGSISVHRFSIKDRYLIGRISSKILKNDLKFFFYKFL